ncbi:MAG: ABC transporter substrate-binding protein [Bacteroidetes bacterium]|jgi:ABC-type Fe3+-hydroxamate transport system substrate-binding protein|nr:ABC transporter substrate-binding protein [Bacteroidota bacterium]MBT5529238.1 ABC transporter substrate-binding protein [Cytophagia bacterium]MBT3424387.1 ABC transporter substrate-binding protein [Bacteroidota bacterium]MBT3802724.1 ABC transporter substrate-binding protein [Bacteroidota bacterium]MBT4337730.1 ABC transporter substrate-binding protein [Bacteroidota bacterium]
MNKVHIDQIGNKVAISSKLERIISTVPSQTELLCFLGMTDKIVGITDFCIHPKEKLEKKTKIGGTKNLDLQKIRELKPDLIISSKEENEKEQIDEISKEFPVWVSDVKSLEDAYKMIERLGAVCNRLDLAQNTSSSIHSGMDLLYSKTDIKIAYLIWENPFMVAAGGTYINDVIKKLGFVNVFSHKKRYPQITSKELKDCGADFILLSSEPYPFNSTHIEEFNKCCPGVKIILVNGQFFSWYGNRLLLALNYFKSIKTVITAIHSS